jgi:hypothetical protein
MADLIVLSAEKKHLMAKDDQPWEILRNIPFYNLPINGFCCFESGERFIEKAISLDLATHNDLKKYGVANG